MLVRAKTIREPAPIERPAYALSRTDFSEALRLSSGFSKKQPGKTETTSHQMRAIARPNSVNKRGAEAPLKLQRRNRWTAFV
jgi:hypothetical protein